MKDFAPISTIRDAPYVLVVHNGLPAKNVAELIALAKAKPRALNYSTVGPASLAQLAGALFASMAGVELKQVPYRSATHAVVDLNEGRIEMQFGAIGASLPIVGRLPCRPHRRNDEAVRARFRRIVRLAPKSYQWQHVLGTESATRSGSIREGRIMMSEESIGRREFLGALGVASAAALAPARLQKALTFAGLSAQQQQMVASGNTLKLLGVA